MSVKRSIAVVVLAMWQCCAQAALVLLPADSKTAQVQSQYARTLWRTGDGLPEDTVQAIVESISGVLWIGTTGGLVRFDGSHMEIPARVKTLLANSVFTLAYGSDGSLWAGTEGGGLLRVSRFGVKSYSVREGLTDGFVRKVVEDHRGRLWVGTDDGLFVLDLRGPAASHLRRVDEGAIAPIAVHAITEDRNGRIWVGGSRLIAIDPDGSEHEFTLQGAYSQNRVKTILQTRDGRMWIGTVGGLQYLDGGKFHVVHGVDATVRTLLEASDGSLWIGTIGDGVWTVDPGHGGDKAIPKLSKVDGQGLLPSATVLYLFEDDQKQIWIGTQAGLVRLNRTPVRVVPLPEGGDPDFETISGDTSGNLWVAAQRLYAIHKGVARRVTYGGLHDVTVRNVYRARDGALWIGTDGSGAYRIDQNSVRHYTAPAELTNNFVRGFLQDRDGAMWIAADEGVSRISQGTNGPVSKKLNQADGLAFFSTRSLLEDREGNLWIGTDRGLSKWRDGHFEQDAATAALAQEKVWSILEDRSGALWFGTRDHGLFRYRIFSSGPNQIRRFTASQGLPSNSIYQVLQDREGTFWISGPDMIASVSEPEMESDSTEEKPLSVQTYRMPFGADGAQLYGGRQTAGYLAPDDSLWFPTNRGAAHLVKAYTAAPPPPRARIDEIVEDGRSFSPDDAHRADLGIAANVVRLSFAFTAVSLRPQEGVRLRYKLEGFDSAWNAAGTGRLATYTNLGAGRYRFRVQAFNTADPSSISEADLSFSKAQLFYETRWFYAFCILIAGCIVWVLYRVRVRGMRTRFAAVLEERSRLAREMHDTVIQGCTSISALLEAMASRVGEEEATSDGLLVYARMQARATIDEARQAIWNMRHEREKDVELIGALRGIAEQMSHEFDGGELQAEVIFEHDAEQIPVAASIAHEILMTVREAVYNSVQHSRSGRVEMNLSTRGDEVIIHVEDAGCGFAMAEGRSGPEGHYGIIGMRERMQRMGGQMQLTSAPGAGTKLQFRLRIGGTK